MWRLWPLSFGATRGFPLVVKRVKPIKVTSSRTAVKFRFDQLLIAQTQPQLGAAQTPVLREANAAVRGKLAGFDLTDGGSDQLAEIPPLLVTNRGYFEVGNWGL